MTSTKTLTNFDIARIVRAFDVDLENPATARLADSHMMMNALIAFFNWADDYGYPYTVAAVDIYVSVFPRVATTQIGNFNFINNYCLVNNATNFADDEIDVPEVAEMASAIQTDWLEALGKIEVWFNSYEIENFKWAQFWHETVKTIPEVKITDIEIDG